MASSGGSRFFHYTAPKRYAQGADDVGRGMAAGQNIGKLMSQFGSAIAGAKQNAVANQLLNKQFPDTPATTTPGGLDPDPDPTSMEQVNPDIPIPDQQLPDVVTPAQRGNLQGGIDELKLRQAMQKQIADQSDAGLDTQIKQARLAGYLQKNARPEKTGVQPQSGNLGNWEQQQAGGGPGTTTTRKGGKPPDPDEDRPLNEPFTNPQNLQKRIDGLHGSGTANYLLQHMDETPDTATAPGFAIFGADPNNPKAKTLKIPVGDLATYQKQYNQIRIKQGLNPIGVTGGDSPANPVDVASNLDAAAVPSGTYIRTPDGKIRQKP